MRLARRIPRLFLMVLAITLGFCALASLALIARTEVVLAVMFGGSILAGIPFSVREYRRMHLEDAERRRANGLCPSCGYDLRATPDRCPECGTCPTE